MDSSADSHQWNSKMWASKQKIHLSHSYTADKMCSSYTLIGALCSVLMSSPSCHLSIAEQILSYVGIHWQLLIYLVFWTVLPLEMEAVIPVGAFWHQVLYENHCLFTLLASLYTHRTAVSIWNRQWLLEGFFCTIKHCKHCFLAVREHGAAQVSSIPTASPWHLAHGRSEGISCSNQNRRAAYSGVYVSYTQTASSPHSLSFSTGNKQIFMILLSENPSSHPTSINPTYSLE